MWKLVAIAAISACTTSEVERPFLVRVDVLGSECPAGADVARQLARRSQGGLEFDQMQCTFEQQLYVSDVVPDPSGIPDITVGCCYRTTCTVALDVAANARLFDAACLPTACRNVDFGSFTAGEVRSRLAALFPKCTLDESPVDRIDVPATTCWYEQYARYRC